MPEENIIPKYDVVMIIKHFRSKELGCMRELPDCLLQDEITIEGRPGAHQELLSRAQYAIINGIQYNAYAFSVGDLIRGRSWIYGITNHDCFGKVVSHNGSLYIDIQILHILDSARVEFIGGIYTVSPFFFRPITDSEKEFLKDLGVIT